MDELIKMRNRLRQNLPTYESRIEDIVCTIERDIQQLLLMARSPELKAAPATVVKGGKVRVICYNCEREMKIVTLGKRVVHSCQTTMCDSHTEVYLTILKTEKSE